MVTREREGRFRVRVMDFGLAHESTDTKLTRTGQLPGTLAYLCPEQVLGLPVDGRGDLYALGAMLYEALRGEPPYSRSLYNVLYRIVHDPVPPLEAAEGLPEGLAELVMACLAKDPAERPARAAELAQRLRALGAGLGEQESARPLHGSSRQRRRPAQPAADRPGRRDGRGRAAARRGAGRRMPADPDRRRSRGGQKPAARRDRGAGHREGLPGAARPLRRRRPGPAFPRALRADPGLFPLAAQQLLGARRRPFRDRRDRPAERRRPRRVGRLVGRRWRPPDWAAIPRPGTASPAPVRRRRRVAGESAGRPRGPPGGPVPAARRGSRAEAPGGRRRRRGAAEGARPLRAAGPHLRPAGHRRAAAAVAREPPPRPGGGRSPAIHRAAARPRPHPGGRHLAQRPRRQGPSARQPAARFRRRPALRPAAAFAARRRGLPGPARALAGGGAVAQRAGRQAAGDHRRQSALHPRDRRLLALLGRAAAGRKRPAFAARLGRRIAGACRPRCSRRSPSGSRTWRPSCAGCSRWPRCSAAASAKRPWPTCWRRAAAPPASARRSTRCCSRACCRRSGPPARSCCVSPTGWCTTCSTSRSRAAAAAGCTAGTPNGWRSATPASSSWSIRSCWPTGRPPRWPTNP